MRSVADRLRLLHPPFRCAALLLLCAAVLPGTTRASRHDWSSLRELAGRISAGRIERTVRELSGADSVTIDGTRALLTTRYTYSQKKPLAARYLIEALETAGYSPVVQEFQLDISPPDIQALAISERRDTVWVGCSDGAVFRATAADGWDEFRCIGRVSHEIRKLALDGRGRLWAACRLKGSAAGGVFVSLDGGGSWELRAGGAAVAPLNSIAFSGTGAGIAAGEDGTVLVTTDTGATWEARSPGPETIYGVSIPSPPHLWMAGDGGRVYESSSAGEDWLITQPAAVRLLDIFFIDGRHGILGGENILYTTGDGGAAWRGYATDEPVRSVAMADSLRLAAAGGNGQITLSDNGGNSWRRLDLSISGGTDLRAAAFMGRDSLWVAGRYEIRLIDLRLPETPAVRLYQIADTLAGYNIIARLPGTRAPEERVLLCAHYDSYAADADPMVRAPGADDNASGSACILETARTLAGAGLDRTVELVLFDSEERGLQGSRHFVEHLDTGAVYTAVINLDMIAFDPSHSRRIIIAGRAGTPDTTLAPVFASAADTLATGISPQLLTGALFSSDHRSFQRLDRVPVVLAIEADYAANPNANAGTDTAGYLDYGYLTDVTRTIFGTVALLSGFNASAQLSPVTFASPAPNPFFDATTLTISLPDRRRIELAVFDVTGRLVAEIERGTFGPGILRRIWNGTDGAGRRVASGVYFARIRSGGVEASRKIVVVR